MKFLLLTITSTLVIFLAACSSAPTQAVIPTTGTPAAIQNETISTSTPETASPLLTPSITNSPQNTAQPDPEETHTPTPTVQAVSATARHPLKKDDWKKLPIIPDVSDHVLDIYQTALAAGNNPQAFSKIGDCGSTPAWFLGDFDRGPNFYDLGQYTSLTRVIQEYQGSFSRTSLAARSGFNASSLFSPIWSDRTYCQANENPLACEYRVHKPVIAFIMLGSNDIWHPDEFEPQMRKIIEYSIEVGVIPIISTKADNEEGDFSINETMARLAWEYDIPLLNYWRAVQDLPAKGLQEDKVHLTWGRNFFNDPEAMAKAWPVRNLTALQALDAVWQKLSTLKN